MYSQIFYIYTVFEINLRKYGFHQLYSSPNTIRMTNQEYRDGQDFACMGKCSNANKNIGRETGREESSL